MRMEIIELGGRFAKVTFVGRLDTPGVDSIETRFIESLVPSASSAIVDMSQVDFISSLGIRMLVSAARTLKLRNAGLALFGVQEEVQRVLEVVSIQQIIPVCQTEADAQAALGGSIA